MASQTLLCSLMNTNIWMDREPIFSSRLSSAKIIPSWHRPVSWRFQPNILSIIQNPTIPNLFRARESQKTHLEVFWRKRTPPKLELNVGDIAILEICDRWYHQLYETINTVESDTTRFTPFYPTYRTKVQSKNEERNFICMIIMCIYIISL